MKKKLLSLVLVGMFALGAVACGGDDAGTDGGTDADAPLDTPTDMTS
jgi:ABC-type glycerol-3-phosphate transport system substrate-binding protein